MEDLGGTGQTNVDQSHLDALGTEAEKEESSVLHYLKIFVKFLLYLITSISAAISMLGISVAFVQVFDHFIGTNQGGLKYVKKNLTSIGVGLGIYMQNIFVH